MPPHVDPVAESTAVQLTRMEGKLDRVADRVADLRQRVDLHDSDLNTLKSRTQSLTEGAAASVATAEALAKALREAKETAEAAARSKAEESAAATREAEEKAALGWSPITRLFAVVAVAAILFNLYQTLSGK